MTKRIAILQSNYIPLAWDWGKEMVDHKLHLGDRHQGLLLGSPTSLAAWDE
jgi:hypothetical protein